MRDRGGEPPTLPSPPLHLLLGVATVTCSEFSSAAVTPAPVDGVTPLFPDQLQCWFCRWWRRPGPCGTPPSRATPRSRPVSLLCSTAATVSS